MPLAIESRQLSKRFLLRHNPAGELKVRLLALFDRSRRQHIEEFWALRSLSLKIAAGESVAMIGRNGSGKSTFLKLVAGIHSPTSGDLLVAEGTRIGSMIELGIGFHPELTGQENVMLNTSIHGLTQADALGLYDAVVAYSGLEHFMDVPLKNYSSGMHMRLGFAIAANLDPDILLLDEIFAVGDDDFQKQCMGTLTSFQAQGKTILFVSHSSAAVQAICHRACLLDRGHLLYDGPVDAALERVPPPDRRDRRRIGARRAGRHPPSGGGGRSRPGLAPARGRRPLGRGRRWVFDFLRRQGLRPEHCSSTSAAAASRRRPGCCRTWSAATTGASRRTWSSTSPGSQIELPRVGVAVELGHFIVNDDFDLSDAPHPFDLAIASSLFRRLTLNGIARCMAGVVKKLAPDGRFYATWLDNPDPLQFGRWSTADGATSYSDRDPFHYSFAVLSALVEAVGGRAERLDDHTHPRGEAVMVITRR